MKTTTGRTAKKRIVRLAAFVLCLCCMGCASGADTAEQFYDALNKSAEAADYAVQQQTVLTAMLTRGGADCGVAFAVMENANGGIAEVAAYTLDYNAHRDDFEAACALATQAYVPKYRKDFDGARGVLGTVTESTEISEKGALLYTEDGYAYAYDFIPSSILMPNDSARFSIYPAD